MTSFNLQEARILVRAEIRIAGKDPDSADPGKIDGLAELIVRLKGRMLPTDEFLILVEENPEAKEFWNALMKDLTS